MVWKAEIVTIAGLMRCATFTNDSWNSIAPGLISLSLRGAILETNVPSGIPRRPGAGGFLSSFNAQKIPAAKRQSTTAVSWENLFFIRGVSIDKFVTES